MTRSRLLPRVFLALLVLALLAGLASVFEFQFSGGGTYPTGSSLRADPGGVMILYESLERLPGLQVSRHTDPLRRLPDEARGTTLFILNADAELLRDADLTPFLEKGGRLVTSVPRTGSPSVVPGVEASRSPFRDPTRARNVSEDPNDRSAPADIPWNPRTVFEIDETATVEPVYETEDGVVLFRERVGDGERLVLSDTALLSNESMYTTRETAWLLWLIGDAERVIFHEHHFGVSTPRGTMTLLREYRLGGVLAALCVSFFLLVWKGAAPLLPPLKLQEEPVRGVQSRLSGFRDLLSRYIPAKEVLRHCLEQWSDTHLTLPAEKQRFADLMEEARREAERPLTRSEKNSPTAGYQRLHTILTRKRTRL